MTDRELLELAAKACGKEGRWIEVGSKCDACKHKYGSGLVIADWERFWNPLTDDGDAFDLAAELEMDIQFNQNYASAQSYYGPHTVNTTDDPKADMRLAIVRAAAEIGKGMKE